MMGLAVRSHSPLPGSLGVQSSALPRSVVQAQDDCTAWAGVDVAPLRATA